MRNHKSTTEGGPFLGAHMSVAGGVSNAVEDARKLKTTALQIFTKNSNQWRAKPLDPAEVERFHTLKAEAGIRFASAHDSYLINLASPKPALWQQSTAAFLHEMDRAETLGLDFLIFHPGAHVGEGVDAGCRRVSDALNTVLDQRPDQKLKLLIENAAGQGTTLGRTFEELAEIRSRIENKKRVGFCFDTCHAFAAGYDLRTKAAYQRTMKEFDRVAGVMHIGAFHLNDCKKDLNCRVDRHEHIGKGKIGREAFRLLLNDKRFSHCPMMLETPKSKDLHEDKANLRVLRRLLTQGV